MKLIKQKRFNECGTAVACNVLEYFKIPFVYKKVRRYHLSNFLKIRIFLNNNNLIANSYYTKQSIYEINFEVCIIQIKKIIGYHFIMLKKDEDGIFVIDPGKSHIVVLNDSTIKKWTGKIMIINNQM